MNRSKLDLETLREVYKNHFRTPRSREEEQCQKELESVMLASRVLQITEFNFFRLSYAQWYGHEVSENGLENIFAEYMFEDIVPHWVRHFTRIVVSLFEKGTLDPCKFDIELPKATLEKRSEGIGYSIILSILLVVFCFLITSQPSPY